MTLNSVESRLVLLIKYYDSSLFKKHDRLVEKHWSAILYREEENITYNSVLYNRAKRYVLYRIRENFGYTLKEYLSLPVKDLNLIDMIAEDINKEKSEVMDDIKNQLGEIDE